MRFAHTHLYMYTHRPKSQRGMVSDFLKTDRQTDSNKLMPYESFSGFTTLA